VIEFSLNLFGSHSNAIKLALIMLYV